MKQELKDALEDIRQKFGLRIQGELNEFVKAVFRAVEEYEK
jgi:uncharacterized protein (DUF2267 family)